MTSFAALSGFAKPGQRIRLTIRNTAGNPEEKNGLLLDLLPDGLVLQTDEEVEYIPAAEVIRWNLLSKDAPANWAPKIPEGESQQAPDEERLNQQSEERKTSPEQPSKGTQISLEDLEIQFAGEPILSHPLPSFDDPDLAGAPRKEIDRWRNRYEYAQKVREPARMASDVVHVADLAESLNVSGLFLLAGSFAHLSGLGLSRSRLYYDAALNRGSRQAAIALASLEIEQKNWKMAAEYLISALLISTEANDTPTLIRVLGQCVLRSTDKKIPGMGDLLAIKFTGAARRLAVNLVLFAIQDDPDACKAIENQDIDALRRSKSGDIIFRKEKPAPEVQPVKQPLTESASRRGRISAFFPDREYGFIVEDTTGQTWFFRINSISDNLLLTGLMKGEVRQYIRFIGNPETPYGKYPLANNIHILSTEGVVVTENQGRAPLKVRLAVVPKDGSSYAKAKKAEQLDQLDQAEFYYREEISQNGRHFKSAVKDLAALQNRQGNPEAAIQTIEQHRSKYMASEMISLYQMIVQFLVKARRFLDAAQLLTLLAKQERNSQKRREWLRQEAYCHFAAGDYDTALLKLSNLLKNFPSDNATQLLIERVKQAKETGSVAGDMARMADDIVEGEESLASLALGLSVLARQHLDKCELRGIDARVRETNTFTERDFRQVETLLERVRGRRPRERADYLATLAALCERAPEAVKENNVHLFLRRHFAAFAEAAMSEDAPLDVVRCYAMESLLLCPNIMSQRAFQSIEIAWVILLGTYFSDRQEPSKLLQPESGERMRLLFKHFVEKPDDWARFMKDAPYYKIHAPIAFSLLEKNLDKSFSPLSLDLSSEKSRSRAEESDFHNLFSGPISAERLRKVREVLAQRASQAAFDLDRIRLLEAVKLFGDSADYALERHFRERETRYLRLDADITRYLGEIEKLPTHLSIERLHPLLSTLLAALRDDFTRAETARPSLEIRNVLDSDFYVVNQGTVALRLLLNSRDESAPPIEAIDLLTEEDNSEPCHSPDPLHGGQSRELELTIHPDEAQIKDGAFSVNILVQYRNRSGTMEKLESQSLAVRLGNDVFEEIPNPYSRYSGGSPVEDETMFFGRSSLVDRIAQHMSTGDAGQCFVLYGQKRSGKSSVLKQVEKRLTSKALFASLSAGAFDPTRLWGSFARLLVQELEFRLEDAGLEIPASWPSRNDVDNQPIETIRDISRAMNRLGHRLIVAIDEFTYIYENSQTSIEDFMRGWKALLEAKTFNALLIGQDTMPRFKQAYPNEFGVTHDERISYLSVSEAERLATQPIFRNRQSRYRGQAFQKLFDLTAGSPFFMQIVCDRLVRHLNARHAPFVTEADIEQVRQQLTVGADALPPERFDPLVTAAGEKVATIPRDILWQLLARVAKESLHSGWCYRSAIADLPRAEDATKDLIDREVLATEGDRVSIRVGLFAAWLRVNQ